jgi:hypothetical protein
LFDARLWKIPHRLGRRAKIFRRGMAQEVVPMTVTSPNVIESKLDRLIDEMRFLRSQMIAFDKRLKEIEVLSY